MSGKKKVIKKKIGEDRTKYHTGKMLKEEDFEDEQEYFNPKKRKKLKPGKKKK